MMGLFGLEQFGITGLNCGALYPRPQCRQFQIVARVWRPKLNSSTIVWGTNTIGGEGAEIDLHTNLGLGKSAWVGEFEGRCQIRQNWGVRYQFMTSSLQQVNAILNGFFFGNALYPPGAQIYSKWDRNIHRWDIVYDWFSQWHAVSSVFAGYAQYDDKLSISWGPAIQRTRSRNMHLAFAGMSIDRLCREIGNGGMASMHCKWSSQFLEGYLGWDGAATARISVPFNCGRYGYLEAGWRWVVLRFDRPSDCDETSLDGFVGAAGLVF
jgi:hypothetical protein